MNHHAIVLFYLLVGVVSSTNTPNTNTTTSISNTSGIYSISTEQWTNLSSSLSPSAALHGPIDNSDYATKCKTLGTDAYAISDAANGICMHAHQCAYEFCLSPDKGHNFDLPLYVVDVRTEEDIVEAINFASSNNITVSVKTTGHSYQGSSTRKETLMIWMHNYPKDGTINDSFTDTCGTTHGPVVGVSGGEIWDDVLEAVKDQYHIVTGGGRTVSAAGGWLMGGGLSFSSREYGIGVDQAIHFRVITPNGTVVDTNACTNTDLFWALRGGGGGSFGVVTHVQYKLHPVRTIVEVNFFYGGYDWAAKYKIYAVLKAIDSWYTFWIEKSPGLDSRWSGFFNSAGAHLVFTGSSEEASSTFLNELNTWYENLDKTDWVPNIFGALPPTVKTHNSWYDYKGGPDAASNPYATDQTGDAYDGINSMAARLMPLSVVVDNPEAVKQLLFDISGSLGTVNYFLGGKMNDVSTNETSVNPALRKSVWSIFTHDAEHSQKVRDFVSNDVTGVCYNHHNGHEPDWRNACWGENYERLMTIKKKYDPKNTFSCWHCVGYVGEEVEYEEGIYAVSTPSPVVSPVATTPAPVASPSTCTDPPFRFKVIKPDGSTIWRDCGWVATQSTKWRCSWEGVSTMCPVACNTCDTCVDSNTRFKFNKIPNDESSRVTRDCGWTGAKATAFRCSTIEGMELACRETCGTCSS